MVRFREIEIVKELALDEVDSTPPLERTIREWQGGVYNLAYRMLGNEADAADATQDVFLALVRNWRRYDSSRPIRPWLLRLALNRIRNLHRGKATRARRELETAARRGAPLEEDSVEEADLKRRVHDALARLPERDRTLIALHYYNGLSHGEMGAVMSLPRTTVQSRLGKALERLRGVLAGAGCVASTAALEAAMHSTAPLEVPVGLSAALSALPAAASGAATGSVGLSMTLGGLVMGKQIIAAAAVLGCFLVGIGAYTTGKRLGRGELESVVAARDAAAAASRKQEEELLARQEKMSKEVQLLRARLEKEARSRASKRTPAADGATSNPQDAAAKAGDGADADVTLDWSKLSSLFAERLDLIYELSEAGRDRQPTKEERRLMAEVESALQDVLAKARKLSDDPFYDERVLLGMCAAMFSSSLGLSGEKEKDMEAAVTKLFADRVEGFDSDAALPVEAYRVRSSFLAGLEDAVGSKLDESQAERWGKVSALARRFLEGDRERVAMPSTPEGGAPAREAGVIHAWEKAFSLEQSQQALVQPYAAGFIERADAVRERYGQLDATPRQLTPSEKAKMQAEILDLQIEVERQLAGRLTPEQREALRGRAPTILQFAPGNEHWTDVRRGAPL